MNILHLLSWFPTPENPTLGNFCLRMIKALPEDCRSVVLSVCEGDAQRKWFKIREIQEDGCVHVQVVAAPSRSRLLRLCRKWLLYQYGLAYVKKQYFRPDLLHVHVAFPAGRLALQWHRWYGYPYVLTEHWTIYQPQNTALLQGALKRRIRRVARHAAMIMPVSQDLQRNMEALGIQRPFRVIYNVVDPNLFRLASAVEGRKKRMLHVSTLRDEAKNFSGILRTLVRLRKERDDFELHVIHDYAAPAFEQFVRENGLNDCVFFHGKKTAAEVAEAYAASDFLLLFSRFENLPCVIVEAMASGLPVLSTDVGGIAEILAPERGVLIPSEDEEALLLGLRQLLDNCRSYDKRSIRDYAVRTFSSAIIGKQLSDAYTTVLQKKSGRD